MLTAASVAALRSKNITARHVEGRVIDVFGTVDNLLAAHSRRDVRLEETTLHALRRHKVDGTESSAAWGPYRAILPPAPDAPAAPSGQGRG